MPVTLWNGNPSSTTARRRRAIQYREFRANRGLYGIGLVLMLLPLLPSLLASLGGTETATMYQSWLVGYVAGQGTGEGILTLIVAALMGIAVMWRDRSRDQLLEVLEGPVSRSDHVLGKIQWLLVAFVAEGVVSALYWLAIAIAAHAVDQMGAVLVRDFWVTAGTVAMGLTGLAMATAMGSMFFAALGSAVWPAAPLLSGSILYAAVIRPTHFIAGVGYVPGPPWAVALYNVLNHLSPFFVPPSRAGWPSLLYGLLFLAVAAAMGYAAVSWWRRAEVERMRDPMVFPFLWNFYYAFLALITGGLATGIVMPYVPSRHSSTELSLILWGIFALIGWFVWRVIVLWIGKSAFRWGPGTELR